MNVGPLTGDMDVDIAIIGSGISGALVAHHLSQSDVGSIVMLDRRPIATGSVTATTALLQYETDLRLTELQTRIGYEKAKRVYSICVEALAHFDGLLQTLPDHCGYARRHSLYLSGPDAGAAQLQAECDARRALGIAIDFLDAATLHERYGIDREAALLSHDAAEVDPMRLTTALIALAVRHGMRLFGETGVAKYESSDDGVTLITDAGHAVRARHIIFATGYESQQFLDGSFVTLSSTFAAISEPVNSFGRWADRCLIWEAATPYFYARTTHDNRILIGGEDEATTNPAERNAMLPAKTEALIEKFHAIFPDVDFIPARSWAAIFGATDDGLPCIGRHPKFPHGYFALGYGGNGITFALIAARMIRDDLLGIPNDDAELFAFDRSFASA